MLPKPTSKPALDWYPLANLLYSELMDQIEVGLVEDIEFFLPYSQDLTLEEHGWANTFSDSAYRCRIRIYFFEDSTIFCWTDEVLGGDEYEFDLDGNYTHSQQEWGTSPNFDASFQEWFDGATSIYEQGIVLLMNSIPTHHFSHDMDLAEVSLGLMQRKWAH
jgi:hypothetical protein